LCMWNLICSSGMAEKNFKRPEENTPSNQWRATADRSTTHVAPDCAAHHRHNRKVTFLVALKQISAGRAASSKTAWGRQQSPTPAAAQQLHARYVLRVFRHRLALRRRAAFPWRFSGDARPAATADDRAQGPAKQNAATDAAAPAVWEGADHGLDSWTADAGFALRPGLVSKLTELDREFGLGRQPEPGTEPSARAKVENKSRSHFYPMHSFLPASPSCESVRWTACARLRANAARC